MVVDAEGVEDVEQGGDEGEERGRSVYEVVLQVLGLRHDGGVCLQDSGTHVQDASGAVVQAVQDSPGLVSFIKSKQVRQQEHQGDEK